MSPASSLLPIVVGVCLRFVLTIHLALLDKAELPSFTSFSFSARSLARRPSVLFTPLRQHLAFILACCVLVLTAPSQRRSYSVGFSVEVCLGRRPWHFFLWPCAFRSCSFSLLPGTWSGVSFASAISPDLESESAVLSRPFSLPQHTVKTCWVASYFHQLPCPFTLPLLWLFFNVLLIRLLLGTRLFGPCPYVFIFTHCWHCHVCLLFVTSTSFAPLACLSSNYLMF